MPPPWNPPPHPGPLRPRGRRGRSRRKNAMHVMYFAEQPMSAYPADIGLEAGHTALMFSNKYFDPGAGSRLYNEYLEQYIYAEEQGIEGFMLNEHHNAPFCMQAKCNIFASILAAVTKKAKIVLLRSEEHTSELQSPCNLVCRLLLEKKNDMSTTLPARI